jgi:epsilon-lactone hydrolase
MRQIVLLPLVTLVVCLTIGSTNAQTTDNTTVPHKRRVPARVIPVPRTVSPELQQAIAQPLDAQKASMERVPESAAGWRQVIAATNASVVHNFDELRAAFPVHVERQTIAGVQTYTITPNSIPAGNRNRVLVHVHGGAYVFYGGEVGIGEAILMASHGKIKVISIDYRMPPEHPFPAALEDAVAVWREVIKTLKPQNCGLFGSSAGGGLTLATVHRLKELKVPLPGALFAGTPWSDLTKAGDTRFTNADIDDVLVTSDGLLGACARLYVGMHDLKHPLVSPVYGDLSGFPPTILVSGTRDLLLSDTVRVHRKLCQAGVDARLHVFEGLSHAQYLSLFQTPECRDAFGQVSSFFDELLGK